MLPNEVKVKAIQSSIPQEQSERIVFEVFDLLLSASDSVAEQVKPDKKEKTLKKQRNDR